MISPRPQLVGLHAYNPGRSIATVKKDTGLAEVVKLASNESLWGPSPRALEQASLVLRDVSRYPEVQSAELLSRLAQHTGFHPNQTLVGNGADEILRLFATAFVDPGQEVIFPSPSFSSYPFATALAGGRAVPVGLTGDGRMDLAAVLKHITPNTRLIYLCSPNNPTGGIIYQDEWDAFLDELPDHLLVVMDSAYFEFVDDPRYADPTPAIRANKPVVMVRTLSKIYGLAGLRIGYALAPAEVVDALRRVREPFSLNLVAEQAALGALTDQAYIARVRQETIKARAYLTESFVKRGYTPYPSQANFLAVPVGSDAQGVASELEQRGFIVRPTTSFGLPGHIRVTVAPIPVLDRFLTKFDEVMAHHEIPVDKPDRTR